MCIDLSNNRVDQHCCDFLQGLEAFKKNAVTQALLSFQRAYECVPVDDFYHNKYASFCGLTRVLSGDDSGLELCRDAASLEVMDGDVFLNLACAEWHMKSRKRAISVLERGLQIDQEHPGLNRFRSNVGVRTRTAISFIPRDSFLNNTLGRLARKSDAVADDWSVQQFYKNEIQYHEIIQEHYLQIKKPVT